MTRKIVTVASIGAVVVLGLALALAWRWSDGSSEFCKGIEEWRSKENAFLIHVNEEGARRGEGLGDTYDIFLPVAQSLVPEAGNNSQDQLRELVFGTVKVHEGWLSDLERIDAIFTALERGSNDALRSELSRRIEEAEVKRVEANNLMRQMNSLLDSTCGLGPLDTYSQ